MLYLLWRKATKLADSNSYPGTLPTQMGHTQADKDTHADGQMGHMKVDTQGNRLTHRGRLVKVKISGIEAIIIQSSHKSGVLPGIVIHNLHCYLILGSLAIMSAIFC